MRRVLQRPPESGAPHLSSKASEAHAVAAYVAAGEGRLFLVVCDLSF